MGEHYQAIPWNEALEFGVVDDYTLLQIHAESIGVTTDWRTFWPDDSIYVDPVEGTQMTISSTSNDDVLGGSGTHTVQLTYLDSQYQYGTPENINMNGQTPVPTQSNDIFRNVMPRSTHAGSVGWNVGTIYVGTGTVTNGIPANIFSVMPATIGQGRGYFYTTPADTVHTFIGNLFTSSGNKDAEMLFRIMLPGETSWFSSGSFDVSDYTNIGIFINSFGPVQAKTRIHTYIRSKAGTVDLKLSTFFKIRNL